MHGSEKTTLIISNEEMENIMKIAKSLEDSDLLMKGVSETIQNDAKEKDALGASLLGNMLEME